MTSYKRLLLTITAVFFISHGGCQILERSPYIGYLYPAGGQLGTVLQMTAGGQFLNGVDTAYISGEGVSVRVVDYNKPLNRMQQQELGRRIREIFQQRANPNKVKLPVAVDTTKVQPDKVMLPDRPIFNDLENKTGPELQRLLKDYVTINRKQQVKESIAETVTMEVTISPDAKPGNREIRLGTPAGLTNPMCFQVGVLPEINEEEPNDPNEPDTTLINIPVTVNGQIMPGDVDRFRFKALKGQNLVVEVQARSLIPYLADAVPGWFQAAVTLYDSTGKEVAFADHYTYNPDPVFSYIIPKDDEYEVEIRDSIYRGREDFVYRISMGELPYVTGMFPLGGRSWSKTDSIINGWNLSSHFLTLDTQTEKPTVMETVLHQNKMISNPIKYVVDTLPETLESEPNNTQRVAQWITLPKIINGRIDKPGDVDVFKFNVKAGDEIVAEVDARRLQSPLDATIRLTNSMGRTLSWNDDYQDKESGLLTHYADSYLRTQIKEDGTYYVQLSDSENQGGDNYSYRLRISAPEPDFSLRITPSSLNIPSGRNTPLTIYAFRKDGFNKDIDVVLKDAPEGFRLSGGRIPVGHESVRMTLATPIKPLPHPIVLQMEGLARIGDHMVSHPVVPAEDMMQAFLYRHLVPAQELYVAVKDIKRRGINILVPNKGITLIPSGGKQQVNFTVPPRVALVDVKLKLNDPPKGISLQDFKLDQGQLTFSLAADTKAVKVGYKDNLIVEAYTEVERNRPDGKKSGIKQQVSLGVLPAIPIEIVKP